MLALGMKKDKIRKVNQNMALNTVIAIIEGVERTLSFNSLTKKYEATITAPNTTSWNEPENKYGLLVKATDVAGNKATADRNHPTLGNSLKLRVLEKTKPTVAITFPSAGATLISNKPTFTFTMRDSGSGVDTSKTVVKVDNKVVTGITFTDTTGGKNATYAPSAALTDGSHTVTIICTDYDGNVSTLVTSTFKIDTVPPTLSITNPTDNLVTRFASLNVTGTTNDAISSPCTVTVKLNAGAEIDLTVASNGTFSKAITLAEGNNTIIVKSTDSAGKYSTVTRTVILDTVAPVIKSITMVPNPVDAGRTFIISVDVED